MRRRSIAPDIAAEVAAIRERLLFTISFIESVDRFSGAPPLREVLEQAADAGNVRALRRIAADMREMATALLPDHPAALAEQLLARFGVDPAADDEAQRRAADRAAARGSVASERERARLGRYADSLRSSGGDAAEIEKVERVLRGDG